MKTRAKIRHLPETDLARCAVMDPITRRHTLFRLASPKKITWTYSPTREALPDIYSVQFGFLGAAPATDPAIIKENVRKRCRTPAALKNNLPLVDALCDFRNRRSVLARSRPFGGFVVGHGHSVNYWSPWVFVIDGKAIIGFHDFRRTHGLTVDARRFVASIQNQHIRLQDPDLSQAALGIFTCPSDEDDGRQVCLQLVDDADLFEAADIARMIAETLTEWVEVNEEIASAARKTGTSGGLFD